MQRVNWILVTLSASLLLGSANVWAFGSAKPQPEPSPSPTNALTTPWPIRPVLVQAMGTTPFPMASAAPIDLSGELDTMLLTAVTGTAVLQPVSSAPSPTPCGSHLEIHAAMTDLNLSDTTLGIQVGYSPAGVITSGVASANGTLSFTAGTIAMDFSLWNCVDGEPCTAVAASTANQGAYSGSLNFSIDYDLITTGAQLVENTDFGVILRALLGTGISTLAKTPAINETPWSASVTEAGSSSVVFSAGSDQAIGTEQTFTVYEQVAGATGQCPVYNPIAEIHTTEVDAVSSTASIDSLAGARAPQVGDLVMIKGQ